MTIINMIGGGGTSGPQVPLDAISVIAVVGGDAEATITWTDPSDLVVKGVTVTTWTATKLVRKVGSAPVDSSDGTLVVTETVKDTYSVSGYNDTGLTNGTTYYYAAFAVGNNGLETISSTTPSVTPEQQGWRPGANTLLYVPMKSDLSDHSSNHFTLTNNGVSLVSNQADIDVGYFSGSSDLAGAYSSLFNFGDFHVGAWIKMSTVNTSQFIFAGTANGNIFMGYQTYLGIGVGRNGIAWDSNTSYSLSANTWYYISFDRQGTSLTLSVNGTVIGTHTNSNSYNVSGGYRLGNDGTGNYIKGYMSDIIIEKAGWSQQERTDYYNQTKSLYGIS